MSLLRRTRERMLDTMNDPRHPAIPNLVPTFDPDPASAGDASPFDNGRPQEDIPLDEEDGDAAGYGRDGD
jgi:hypothetical protein